MRKIAHLDWPSDYCIIPGASETGRLVLASFNLLRHDMLTIINATLANIKNTNSTVPDLEAIEMTETAVFTLLVSGDMQGIFQLEEEGRIRYFAKIKPERIEDIIALFSLARPGPIACGMMDSFINRKNGEEAITYIHRCLENLLSETCGILVYQEQVMEIATAVAGFSRAAAVILLKNLRKLKHDKLAKERTKFVAEARKKGVAKADAEAIFSWVEMGTQYTFSRAAATEYALLIYRAAWLKLHYPEEFLEACKKFES